MSTRAHLAALVLATVLAGALRAEDERIFVGANGTTRANAWTEIQVAAAKDGAGKASPESAEVVDPWGLIVWTGPTRDGVCSFFTRAWADGAYKLRLGSADEVPFRVDTEYFDGIRARAGLMLRAIDARRDADGQPPKEWWGASNLLQRIITLHLWRESRQKVEQHMSFCEQQLGFRTATASVRLLGSGAANVPGYAGPYRPLARERNMMFMPPNAVFDFNDLGRRKLERWGYGARDIEHVFISHSHADHFDAKAVLAFARLRVDAGLGRLTVHSGKASCDQLRQLLVTPADKDLIAIDELEPGRRTVAGELEVEAVAATHAADSDPLCYIARWRGATVYYGTDTGYPRAPAYASLAARRFDVFAHEMTAASGDDGMTHMDLGDFQLLVGKLRAAGAIDPWTRVVSMHQSPEGPQILPDYGHFQQSIGFECGYDGMPIPIAYRLDETAR